MDNIYVYFVSLPATTIHEIVLPCCDGYTIYIDDRLSHEQQVAAYRHALEHIRRNDFEKVDVDEIEHEAHE